MRYGAIAVRTTAIKIFMALARGTKARVTAAIKYHWNKLNNNINLY